MSWHMSCLYVRLSRMVVNSCFSPIVVPTVPNCSNWHSHPHSTLISHPSPMSFLICIKSQTSRFRSTTSCWVQPMMWLQSQFRWVTSRWQLCCTGARVGSASCTCLCTCVWVCCNVLGSFVLRSIPGCVFALPLPLPLLCVGWLVDLIACLPLSRSANRSFRWETCTRLYKNSRRSRHLGWKGNSTPNYMCDIGMVSVTSWHGLAWLGTAAIHMSALWCTQASSKVFASIACVCLGVFSCHVCTFAVCLSPIHTQSGFNVVLSSAACVITPISSRLHHRPSPHPNSKSRRSVMSCLGLIRIHQPVHSEGLNSGHSIGTPTTNGECRTADVLGMRNSWRPRIVCTCIRFRCASATARICWLVCMPCHVMSCLWSPVEAVSSLSLANKVDLMKQLMSRKWWDTACAQRFSEQWGHDSKDKWHWPWRNTIPCHTPSYSHHTRSLISWLLLICSVGIPIWTSIPSRLVSTTTPISRHWVPSSVIHVIIWRRTPIHRFQQDGINRQWWCIWQWLGKRAKQEELHTRQDRNGTWTWTCCSRWGEIVCNVPCMSLFKIVTQIVVVDAFASGSRYWVRVYWGATQKKKRQGRDWDAWAGHA